MRRRGQPFMDTHRFERWMDEEQKRDQEEVFLLEEEERDPLAVTELSNEEHNKAILEALEGSKVRPERLTDGHSSRAAAGSNCVDIYRRCKMLEEERTRDFERMNREERKFKNTYKKMQEENAQIEEKKQKRIMKSNYYRIYTSIKLL